MKLVHKRPTTMTGVYSSYCLPSKTRYPISNILRLTYFDVPEGELSYFIFPSLNYPKDRNPLWKPLNLYSCNTLNCPSDILSYLEKIYMTAVRNKALTIQTNLNQCQAHRNYPRKTTTRKTSMWCVVNRQASISAGGEQTFHPEDGFVPKSERDPHIYLLYPHM